MTDYIDVDVRPILRAGGEPFSTIMAALEKLEPGQGLRLFAPFKPIPLFGVMADKGFAHTATELDAGEWEVLFTSVASAPPAAENLSPGETLSALLRREPVFLFRELEKRGHHWRGGFTPDGSTYELTVRVSS